MAHTLSPHFEQELESPEQTSSKDSFSVPQGFESGDDEYAWLAIDAAHEESPAPRPLGVSKQAQSAKVKSEPEVFTREQELEIAKKAALDNHGADYPPTSWGGVVTSSRPVPGLAVADVQPKRIEQLNTDSLPVPAFSYGHLTVVPMSSRDQFRKIAEFLYARRKSSQDKAVIVTSKRVQVNVTPDLADRLANGGVIIINGDEEDPIRGAKKFIREFAVRRQQSQKNFDVFMRRA